MRNARSLIVIAWTAVLLTACGKSNAKATAGTTSVVDRSAPPASPIEDARRLALAVPHGGAAVDALIVQHQASAQQNQAQNDAWIALGRDWIRKAREAGDPGYYGNAGGAAEVALANQPKDKLAMGLHAMVLMNDHRFEEARVAAEQAVALDPDDPNAYAPWSDALLELGRVDEAEQAIQKMVDLKPSLPAYARVAHFRWLHGDREGALSAYKLAISAGADARDPEPKAWALLQAATIFWQVGELDGADAGALAALGVFADYPPALVLQARVALARGNAAKAVALLERAYQASPLVETAWALGDARTAAGDAKGAEAAFLDVEKRGRLTDRRTLAFFYATKNRSPGEAKDALHLMEAEEKNRADVDTDDAYAWTLYRNGRFADAQLAIDRARRLGTKEAGLFYHAGAIRIATGDVAGGTELVKEALALNAHFDETGAAEARAMVSPGAGKP